MSRLKYTLFLLSVSFLFATNVFASDTHQKEILFFSNINAAVKNCNCGNPSLGGLARIITIVKNRRKENPNLILVDGGDFLNSYPFPSLNKAVVELYKELKPDIITAGDQEFVEGTLFLTNHLTNPENNLLHTNMQYSKNDIPEDRTGKIFIHDRLVFLSYLDTDAFDLIKKPQEILLSNSYFKELHDNIHIKNNFLIGLFHGSEKKLDGFIKTYPKFDLILFGHAQSNRKQLSVKPVIVGGGSDGENIKKINITYDTGILSIKTEDIPVTLDIIPDETAMKIIQRWGVK